MLRRTLIIGLAASLSGCGPHYDQKEAERYIVDSERQWAESVATGDTTVLERILADDFVGVDPKGPFYDKAKMIAHTREAPKYFASTSTRSRSASTGTLRSRRAAETWER